MRIRPSEARSARDTALTIAVVGAVTSSLAAQTQFREMTSLGVPPRFTYSTAVAHGDVDGDGDLDLVIGEKFWRGRNRLLLNDGHGNYADATETHMPVVGDFTEDVALGDLDGDGDLDLLVANSETRYSWTHIGNNRTLINDGTGRFEDATDRQLAPMFYESYAIETGDLDGDGDVDVVVSGWVRRAPHGFLPAWTVLLNDGRGSLLEAAVHTTPRLIRAIALADFDGDSDLDVLLGSERPRYYRNDGTAGFTDLSTTSLSTTSVDTVAIAVGDIDGDGDLDVALGNDYSYISTTFPVTYASQNRILVNDGTGVFTDESLSRLPHVFRYTRAIDFADLDGDGDLDLLVGNKHATSPDVARQTFINDGSGSFTNETAARVPNVSHILTRRGHPEVSDFAVFDSDGDGDIDIFSTDLVDQDRAFKNDGTGVFEEVTELGWPLPFDRRTTRIQRLADFTGDGFPDLIRQKVDAQFVTTAELLINNGQSGFEPSPTALPQVIGTISCIVPFDSDADGDLDIFLGILTVNSPRALFFRNDAAGAFADVSTSTLPGIDPIPLDGEGEDIDGDGDLDLVLLNRNSMQVLENDGFGSFTDVSQSSVPPLPLHPDRLIRLAMGDIDNDGDADAILAVATASGPQQRVLLNDGTGAFTDESASRLPSNVARAFDIQLGDIDRDGDLDLVTLRDFRAGPNYPSRTFQVFMNSGQGAFSEVPAAQIPYSIIALRDPGASGQIALVDYDADGDLDLLAAPLNPGRYEDSTPTFFPNDGQGTFTNTAFGRVEQLLQEAQSVAVGDLDLDGDPDLVLGEDFQDSVLLNLVQQTDLRGDTYVGDRLEIDVYATYAESDFPVKAVPFLSLAPASVPTRFGRLGLDLNLAIPLPPVTISPVTGLGSTTYPIPADPTLSGVPFYVQTLLSPFPRPPRLTNAESKRLR